MNERSNALIRVVIRYDEKGRKTGYDVVETSKNPYFIANLESEIKKNVKIIEKENAEKAESLQREQELQAFLSHYSLKKFLTLTNVALLTGGWMDSSHHRSFVEEVRKIMQMPATLERAIAIENVLQQAEYATLKEAFERMED